MGKHAWHIHRWSYDRIPQVKFSAVRNIYNYILDELPQYRFYVTFSTIVMFVIVDLQTVFRHSCGHDNDLFHAKFYTPRSNG
jgi:hypothetical protein